MWFTVHIHLRFGTEILYVPAQHSKKRKDDIFGSKAQDDPMKGFQRRGLRVRAQLLHILQDSPVCQCLLQMIQSRCSWGQKMKAIPSHSHNKVRWLSANTPNDKIDFSVYSWSIHLVSTICSCPLKSSLDGDIWEIWGRHECECSGHGWQLMSTLPLSLDQMWRKLPSSTCDFLY